MVILENPPVYNVVFIVEGTANVGAYFDSLKGAYILPTLECVYHVSYPY
jgi:Mediator complex subunit 25 von Willebrand factor type A